MIPNMERDMKTYTYKIVEKSILGMVICATLFLVSSAMVSAADSNLGQSATPAYTPLTPPVFQNVNTATQPAVRPGPTVEAAARANATVQSTRGSELFTPRYLPNILLGAKGPADMIFFLYKYLLGLVGIVAVGVIIYGGVLRTVSADMGKIRASNEYIRNALKGIVLLFGAQVLFNTINPNIVDFPRIQKAIQPKEKFVPNVFTGVDIGFAPEGSTSTGAGSPLSISSGATAFKCSGCVNLDAGNFKLQTGEDKLFLTNASFGRLCSDATGKPTGQGCQIQKDVALKLNALARIIPSSKWQVSEAWPPTVYQKDTTDANGVVHKKGDSIHLSSCHSAGTCVDITLSGGSAAEVNAMLAAAKQAGFTRILNEYTVGNNPKSPLTKTGDNIHIGL